MSLSEKSKKKAGMYFGKEKGTVYPKSSCSIDRKKQKNGYRVQRSEAVDASSERLEPVMLRRISKAVRDGLREPCGTRLRGRLQR